MQPSNIIIWLLSTTNTRFHWLRSLVQRSDVLHLQVSCIELTENQSDVWNDQLAVDSSAEVNYSLLRQLRRELRVSLIMWERSCSAAITTLTANIVSANERELKPGYKTPTLCLVLDDREGLSFNWAPQILRLTSIIIFRSYIYRERIKTQTCW